MKSLIALLLSGLFASSVVLAGEKTTSAPDQKWLKVVEEMVVKGDRKISTPSEDRVNLLKDWAAKNGYSAKVTKISGGYSIEVSGDKSSKSVAKK